MQQWGCSVPTCDSGKERIVEEAISMASLTIIVIVSDSKE